MRIDYSTSKSLSDIDMTKIGFSENHSIVEFDGVYSIVDGDQNPVSGVSDVSVQSRQNGITLISFERPNV